MNTTYWFVIVLSFKICDSVAGSVALSVQIVCPQTYNATKYNRSIDSGKGFNATGVDPESTIQGVKDVFGSCAYNDQRKRAMKTDLWLARGTFQNHDVLVRRGTIGGDSFLTIVDSERFMMSMLIGGVYKTRLESLEEFDLVITASLFPNSLLRKVVVYVASFLDWSQDGTNWELRENGVNQSYTGTDENNVSISLNTSEWVQTTYGEGVIPLHRFRDPITQLLCLLMAATL